MLADFKTSFTVGLSSKSAARRLAYFPPHLKYVTTLPCEIQKINNSNWCIFEKCWRILKILSLLDLAVNLQQDV